jgi:hypothetical protein
VKRVLWSKQAEIIYRWSDREKKIHLLANLFCILLNSHPQNIVKSSSEQISQLETKPDEDEDEDDPYHYGSFNAKRF